MVINIKYKSESNQEKNSIWLSRGNKTKKLGGNKREVVFTSLNVVAFYL